MDTLEVLSQVVGITKYENNYKEVVLGDELDYTSYLWKGEEFLGTVSWGFSYGYTFSLETFLNEGNLDKVLSI